MKTFILLVGLPGSGKTHYGNSLGLPFLDDIAQNGGVSAVLKLAETSDSVVLSDFCFIMKEYREAAIRLLKERCPGCDVRFVVFKNEPEKCWRNILRRQDGRVILYSTLHRNSKQYTYPDSADKFLPVYSE